MVTALTTCRSIGFIYNQLHPSLITNDVYIPVSLWHIMPRKGIFSPAGFPQRVQISNCLCCIWWAHFYHLSAVLLPYRSILWLCQ